MAGNILYEFDEYEFALACDKNEDGSNKDDATIFRVGMPSKRYMATKAGQFVDAFRRASDDDNAAAIGSEILADVAEFVHGIGGAGYSVTRLVDGKPVAKSIEYSDSWSAESRKSALLAMQHEHLLELWAEMRRQQRVVAEALGK